MKASKIQLTSIEDASRRFDPSYHLSDAIVVKKTIAKSPYPLLKLKEVSSGIFNGGRYKRVYVSNPKHGYKFLSSSDILAADLESVKMVSKRYMGGVKELALEKGWILITRSGTIGKTAFANAKHPQSWRDICVFSIQVWIHTSHARYFRCCNPTYRVSFCR